MDETQNVIYEYQKLINLLEEERTGIANCIKGDILDAYQSLLREEIQRLSGHAYSVKTYYQNYQ